MDRPDDPECLDWRRFPHARPARPAPWMVALLVVYWLALGIATHIPLRMAKRVEHGDRIGPCAGLCGTGVYCRRAVAMFRRMTRGTLSADVSRSSRRMPRSTNGCSTLCLTAPRISRIGAQHLGRRCGTRDVRRRVRLVCETRSVHLTRLV